ncbi:hypothetical protein ACROYT_G033126 [Oculina patagonica]
MLSGEQSSSDDVDSQSKRLTVNIGKMLERLEKLDEKLEEVNTKGSNIEVAFKMQSDIRKLKERQKLRKNMKELTQSAKAALKRGVVQCGCRCEEYTTISWNRTQEMDDPRGNLEIQRVHCRGRSKDGKPRPILARLLRYQDKTTIMKLGWKLRDTAFNMFEELPQQLVTNRKKLYSYAALQRC